MKTIILALACFAIGTSYVAAQTVNDVPLSQINEEYVQIVGTSKIVGNKVTIEVDFGQHNSFWTATGNGNVIKDADGKKMEFNSMIDALNFMAENGYEVVQAYAFSTGSQNVYHYLLQKQD